MPQTLNMHHSSNFNTFSQSKSTKCEIFAWYCDFFRNHLSQRHETCSIGFGMPQTLHMCYSSHFNPFFPVKINKCEFFTVSWTPPDKNWKQDQFSQGKSFHKDLQICTYRFLGMPIAMHFVTTLCDKYFLNYYGFSAFVMGRSRYWVLKHGVRVKCDPRRTAAYVPSHFHGFEPHLLLCVS